MPIHKFEKVLSEYAVTQDLSTSNGVNLADSIICRCLLVTNSVTAIEFIMLSLGMCK